MHPTESLEFPHAKPPEPGTALQLAPGIRWLRKPLPFALDHINLWLIEEGAGWTLIDTGLGNRATRDLWKASFDTALGGRPIGRIVVTHYHPDHAGNAAWLCERFNAPLWMTRGEFLTVHSVLHGVASFSAAASSALFRANGIEAAAAAALNARGDLYSKLVPAFPQQHRRLMEGATVNFGGQDWRVIIGHGHAPEHASLYCEKLNVLISGDMLLPKISTNVAVRPIDPMADPLGQFLKSIRRYNDLPEDVLVLPSHGMPFRGAHTRVAQLEAHHAERLDALVKACSGAPRSAADLLEVLFRRKLDSSQIFFAMGEAIAHVHHLFYAGRLHRSVDAYGVARFSAA
jgi:glyoxylase-like metal-dependent hydrolase (beta-lactamase superfamily II)